MIREQHIPKASPAICYVAPSLDIEDDYRFARKQCPGLVKKGFEVSYFLKSNTKRNFQGVNIFPIEHEKNKFKQTLLPWKILGRLLKQPCDAYHLSTAEMLPIALILKLITKRRVVFDFHEDYVEFIRLKPYLKEPFKCLAVGVARLLVWLVCKSMDGLVFGDEAVQESYPSISSKRQVIIHHFPLLSMCPVSPVPFAQRKFDIVYTGNLSRLKGAFEMLEVVRLLKERYKDFRVLFVGGPLSYIKEEFYQYIRDHKLEDCLEITGRVPYERVSGLLDQCKVGLISLHDTLKYRRQSAAKLFEYMAKGIPCVSVDLPPERRFMVEAEHGYFVPPQDPQAMADAVYRIISNPELGQKMAKKSREHFLKKGYYGEKERDKLAEFYHYILAHPRRHFCRS